MDTAHWIYYNPNPDGIHVEDCVVRAICAATGETWDDVYTELAAKGFGVKNMPSSNATWRGFLRKKGFQRAIIPNTCPDCYTVGDFADDHPTGAYILGTGRRGRDSMGRYTSRDNGDFMSALESAADRAPDERTREDIERMMSSMRR